MERKLNLIRRKWYQKNKCRSKKNDEYIRKKTKETKKDDIKKKEETNERRKRKRKTKHKRTKKRKIATKKKKTKLMHRKRNSWGKGIKRKTIIIEINHEAHAQVVQSRSVTIANKNEKKYFSCWKPDSSFTVEVMVVFWYVLW